MPRSIPWRTLEEAITVLSTRRNVLARQIEALRMHTGEREVLLLVQYVVLGSAKGVAEWANAKEWRLAGAKGQMRRYTPDDITALIATPPPTVSPDLHGLVRDIFSKNSNDVHHAFG